MPAHFLVTSPLLLLSSWTEFIARWRHVASFEVEGATVRPNFHTCLEVWDRIQAGEQGIVVPVSDDTASVAFSRAFQGVLVARIEAAYAGGNEVDEATLTAGLEAEREAEKARILAVLNA
jgi:hypothetical protein